MTTRLEHLTSLIWRAKAHCPADLWSAMRENVEALAATDSVGKTAESQKNSSDDSRSKPVLPKVPDAEKIAARLRIYDLVDESARGALIWSVSVLMKEAREEVRVEERARAAAYAADEIAYAQRPSDAVPPECAVNPVLSRVCVKGTKSCALTHEHDVPRTPEAWDDHGGRPVNPDPTQGPWTDKAAAPERDWKTIAEGLMVALETGERLDALRARFGLKPALPHSPRLQGERSVEFSDALPEGWDIISKDNGTAYCLEGPWFNTRREAIASLPRSANPVPDVDEVVRVAAKLCSFHPCRCEDAYTARGRHAPGCMYVELEDLREALARRRASRSQAVELHCDSCDDDPRLGPRLPSEMTHCAGCYAVLESHYGAALKRVADLSEELAFERDSKRPVATLSTICPKCARPIGEHIVRLGVEGAQCPEADNAEPVQRPAYVEVDRRVFDVVHAATALRETNLRAILSRPASESANEALSKLFSALDALPAIGTGDLPCPETPRPEENIVSALAKIARADEASAQRRWRTGWSLGRTLYCDGICVGMVDRPDIAEAIVIAMNASHATETSQTPTGDSVLAKGLVVSRGEGQAMVRFSHGYAWVNDTDLKHDANVPMPHDGYQAGWSAAIKESAKLCERWAWSKRTEEPPEQAMAAEECAKKIRALDEKSEAGR